MLKERYPSKLLEDAVEAIGTLPGVGKRSAMRLALHVLRQPSDNVHHLADALVHLRDDVKYCRECMMISDSDVCSICSDTRRDHNTICVVETVRDIMSIENTGRYGGVYHVLGGSISPIDGIGPSDLSIAPLVERVKALCASVTPGPDPVTPGPDPVTPGPDRVAGKGRRGDHRLLPLPATLRPSGTHHHPGPRPRLWRRPRIRRRSHPRPLHRRPSTL